MAIVARDSGSSFTPAPEGLWQAVCCDVVDMGMVKGQWGEKHKVRIVWQIDEVNPETGKRFQVSGFYSLSLHKKAVLRGTLEAWRGKKFSEEELRGFDLEKLIGANCQVQIVHNIREQSTYANVQAVVPLSKGTPPMGIVEYQRARDRQPESNGFAGSPGVDESAPDDDLPF